MFPLFQQSFSGDLMIRNIQLNHGGKYVCLVDTDVESLSADAILVVKGRNKLSSLCLHAQYLLSSTVKSFLRGVYFNKRALLM